MTRCPCARKPQPMEVVRSGLALIGERSAVSWETEKEERPIGVDLCFLFWSGIPCWYYSGRLALIGERSTVSFETEKDERPIGVDLCFFFWPGRLALIGERSTVSLETEREICTHWGHMVFVSVSLCTHNTTHGGCSVENPPPRCSKTGWLSLESTAQSHGRRRKE